MAFRELTLGRLPRVMVAILAMDEDDRRMVAEAFRGLRSAPALLEFVTLADMAKTFDEILHLPKERRLAYVAAMSSALDGLRKQDAFGTEGQLDPRGDPRE